MRTILLAAGLSTRMGRQKLLLPFCGGSVLSTVIDRLLSASLAPVLLVTSRATLQGVTLVADIAPVINDAPERGQSSSLLLGLERLEEGEDFCLMLGDLPLITAEALAESRAEFLSLPPCYSALVPISEGRYGHPSFFASVWRERFLAAHGDAGGRRIIQQHEGEVRFFAGEDSFFHDLDTPRDYENLSACGAPE